MEEEPPLTCAETNYATAALVEYLLRKNLAITEIRILCTEQAKNEHFDKLSSALRHLVSDASIEEVSIPLGGESADFWEIFKKTQDCFSVKDGMGLVVDITHAFRSLPFFAGSVLAFLMATAKLPEVVDVYYGAYEMKPPQLCHLSQFVEVLRWAYALFLFLETGRAQKVGDLLEHYRKVAPRGTSKDDPGIRGPLAKIAEAIKKWSDDFETLRVKSLLLEEPTAQGLVDAIESNKASIGDSLPPLTSVLEDIVKEYGSPLLRAPKGGAQDKKSAFVASLLELAKIYVKKGRYLEAIAVTREAIISGFAEHENAWVPGNDFEDSERSKAEARVRDADRALALAQNTDRGPIDALFKVRNDMLHAGFNRSPQEASTLKKQVENIVSNASEMLVSLKRTEPIAGGIFLNLSNHPSSAWSEEQKDASLALGCSEIVDEQFPNVDPSWAWERVSKEAKEVVDAIFEKYGGRIRHAMVEGEFSMTVELVKKLQGKGVKCYVATTERDVVVEGDVKKSRFSFKRFREYPWIA
jgi:CRISPR-associated protein Csx16